MPADASPPDDARTGSAAKPSREDDPIWVMGTSVGSEEMLACTYDTYGGVIIDPGDVPSDVGVFRRRMASSLAAWRADGRKGIWLELRTADAALIPVAAGEFGFEFHQADPGRVVLTAWLPTDCPNSLPGNASHTVGIGAIVVDEEAERVLLVKERTGPAARLGIWKLPTGLVDAGEEIHQAAVREVKEETGVDAEFVDIRAFRTNHMPNLAHKGKSNIFFVVRLRVRAGSSAEALQPAAGEIADVRWFTIQEFEARDWPPQGSLFELLNRSAFYAGACYRASEVGLGPGRKGTNWLYYPEALK